MSRIRPCVLLAALAVLGATGPGASAATWTEIPSGTTEDITAIDYQGPDRMWFATGAGHVYRLAGGAFVQTGTAPGVVFKDIEFQDGGPVGFAVGSNGGVLRSADGGATWSAVTGMAGGQTGSTDCAAADQPLGDVDSVHFDGNARVWLVGGGTQIYRTIDGATASDVGATAAGWQFINDNGVTCKVTADIDDLFPVGGSGQVYFVAKSLGVVFFSPNALATSATVRAGAAGASARGTRRLVGDPADPSRQWAVSSGGGGPSVVARTTDGWATTAGWTIANPDLGGLTTPEGVDFNGGTVMAAGSGGMIAESSDGASFYIDAAPGAAATQDWRAVSLASSTAAAVGGTGGRLVVTSDANVPPVPPPPRQPLTITPARLPLFGFPPQSKPPVIGGVARTKGAFVVVRVRGAFAPPAGIPVRSACRGRVVLTVMKERGKRRDLTDATVGLAGNCAYRKRLRVRRTRIGPGAAVLLRVAFKGNPFVGASSMTYRVRVRRSAGPA